MNSLVGLRNLLLLTGLALILTGICGLIYTINSQYNQVAAAEPWTEAHSTNGAGGTTDPGKTSATPAEEASDSPGRRGRVTEFLSSRAGGFYSLYWILGGSLICLCAILWLSRLLTKQWTDAVGQAFKLMGILILVLLGFYMLTLWATERRREADERLLAERRDRKEADEIRRREDNAKYVAAELARSKEEEEARERAFLDQAEKLKQQFGASPQPSPHQRLILLTGAITYIRSRNISSSAKIVLFQTLYDQIKIETDTATQALMKKALFPGTAEDDKFYEKPIFDKPFFAEAVAEAVVAFNGLSPGAVGYKDLASRLSEYWLVVEASGSLEESLRVSTATELAKLKSGKVDEAAKAVADQATTAPITPESVQNAIVASESTDSMVRNKAESILVAAPKELVQAAAPVTFVNNRRPRVYIQAPAENWRNVFSPSRRKEYAANYIIPGLEVVKNPPPVTEVRYFNPDLAEDAKGVVNALRSFGINNAIALLQRPTGSDKKMSPNIGTQIEVWLGSDAAIPSASAK